MMSDGRRCKQRDRYTGKAESCPGHDPLRDVRKRERTTNAAAQESDSSTVLIPAALTTSCGLGTLR
jgi:hypothetical protein